MELVKKGYKKTEVGVIPEDWEIKTLGELGELKNGINKSAEDFGFGFPFANLMDVFGKSSIENTQNFGLINSSSTERSLYNLKAGDVLFIRSSVKPSGVGLTALIKFDLKDTVFSGFLIRFRDEGLLDIDFKKHCFYGTYFRNSVIACSTVSANTNINQESIKRLSLIFPPTLTEQKAIATALSDVDELISKLEKLIEKKKAIKQGAMQQLLTPNYNWTTKTTLELCEKLWIGLVTTMTSNYVKQGVPLVRNSDIKVNRFKTDLINLEENFANIHKSRAFQEEDVATVHTGDVGTSAVVPKWLDGAHGFATINSRLKRNIISPWYYSYYLNSPLLKNQLKEVITGDGRSNLNLYDFVNLKISFPTLIEQNTIVEILTTMDIEIEELVNKKSKYFLLKQGMMQELLTGKTRLI
jgi:type I restriction enzyme S subunit